MTAEECRVKLLAGRVGRVAVTKAALPVIAPVNYVVDGDSVLFRTRSDSVIADSCDGSVIAFEVDEVTGDGSSGWSVNVVGIASVVPADEEPAAARRDLVSAVGDGLDRCVRLRIGLLTGRRIDAVPLAAVQA
jgi:nitroimidazol reductase NimA-like FMN-containing flavoprotein (pyridoxamine 5'-phosphate oxidase superfamily)